jgi:hypothetical protein
LALLLRGCIAAWGFICWNYFLLGVAWQARGWGNRKFSRAAPWDDFFFFSGENLGGPKWHRATPDFLTIRVALKIGFHRRHIVCERPQ